jgi:23S rRNA (pseudouridine1915-N3)-methyltransferase
MKICFYTIGTTSSSYLKEGIVEYLKRIEKYTKPEYLEIKIAKAKKTTDPASLRAFERDEIMKYLQPNDYLVLLDERGKEFTSQDFAKKLEYWMNTLQQRLVFVAGGAFGFHPDLYLRKKEQMAISQMTFTHDMVRLVFLEQLYRAFTILNNEPYHH